MATRKPTRPPGRRSKSGGTRSEAGRHPRHKPKTPRPAKEPPREGGIAIPRGASAHAAEFPVAENLWRRFFDDRLPYWVKQTYAPERYRAEAGFNEKDALYFAPSVKKLSDQFIGRALDAQRATEYFKDAKYRAAYLLYFVPLQAAKFVRLFNIHAPAVRAALREADKQGVLRVADLGSGPATATLGLLTWLVSEHGLHRGDKLPPIEVHLLDTDERILADGVRLIEEFRKIYGVAPERIKVHAHRAPLADSASVIPEGAALTLVGNVFNESLGIHEQSAMKWMPEMIARSKGGGVLLVEPAAPENAAFLSNLRDRLLSTGAVPRDAASLWGPCLHAQACPLAQSRDWCHFSTPGGIPGQWFKALSENIGSERQWLKFSYLWLAAPGSSRKLDKIHGTLRRVVSGPMKDTRGGRTLLICEPEKPGRASAPNRPVIGRGDIVTLRPIRRKRSFGERER